MSWRSCPIGQVLILEDYHVITSSEVNASLAFLIDHLPASLHVIIMTRSEPQSAAGSSAHAQ